MYIYCHPVSILGSAIGFCETEFRFYFQTFVLSSNSKTGTRCNDQSRLLLIFTGSRLYHKYHIGDEENNHLMIPKVMLRSFNYLANLSLWPDRRELELNHWKKLTRILISFMASAMTCSAVFTVKSFINSHKPHLRPWLALCPLNLK